MGYDGRVRRPLAGVISVTLLALGGGVWAQRAPAPAAAHAARSPVAVFRVEPLGLDAERAARLEALFRLELERLVGGSLPSKAAVEKTVASDATLRGCTGEPDCLAVLGGKLGVRQVVTGNVGELGDAYVINLKLVDVASKAEVRRVSEPLKGNPDELIETVRVAAYRLFAPERLRGSLAILSDVSGGEVYLDGKAVGRTPILAPITNLEVGTHKLRIVASGYTEFQNDAEVRFQKTTQVVVRMVLVEGPASKDPGRPRPAETPWYSTTWGYVGIGVGAILIGAVVGAILVPDEITRCDDVGSCM
jgi:hypothetical protein